MIENNKNRHTVWLTDEAWNMVGGEYKADGCSTQNEYIEKAIRFYTGYRKADHNERYLTDAISGALETRLGALGDRIGKLLFKMAVELSMMLHVTAAANAIDETSLTRLRGLCVEEVKRLHGAIRMEDAVRFQKGGASV